MLRCAISETRLMSGISTRFQSDRLSPASRTVRIGRGEQGVLLVEPCKSEILPYWKFKTPDIARQSAAKIYGLFLQCKAEGDFVGMDMARKFLQMGNIRSRRYANHKSGRKYAAGTKAVLPREEDSIKAESARIFYGQWQLVKIDPEYVRLAARHRDQHEGSEPVVAKSPGSRQE
jgi:hypothetical protein